MEKQATNIEAAETINKSKQKKTKNFFLPIACIAAIVTAIIVIFFLSSPSPPAQASLVIEILDASEGFSTTAELYLQVSGNEEFGEMNLLYPLNIGSQSGQHIFYKKLPLKLAPDDELSFNLLDEDGLSDDEEKVLFTASQATGFVFLIAGKCYIYHKIGVVVPLEYEHIKPLINDLTEILVLNMNQHPFDAYGHATYIRPWWIPKKPKDSNWIEIFDTNGITSGKFTRARVKVYYPNATHAYSSFDMPFLLFFLFLILTGTVVFLVTLLTGKKHIIPTSKESSLAHQSNINIPQTAITHTKNVPEKSNSEKIKTPATVTLDFGKENTLFKILSLILGIVNFPLSLVLFIFYTFIFTKYFGLSSGTNWPWVFFMMLISLAFIGIFPIAFGLLALKQNKKSKVAFAGIIMGALIILISFLFVLCWFIPLTTIIKHVVGNYNCRGAFISVL